MIFSTNMVFPLLLLLISGGHTSPAQDGLSDFLEDQGLQHLAPAFIWFKKEVTTKKSHRIWICRPRWPTRDLPSSRSPRRQVGAFYKYANIILMITGRICHHFAHLFFRFDRREVKKSGRAAFTCSVRGCSARYNTNILVFVKMQKYKFANIIFQAWCWLYFEGQQGQRAACSGHVHPANREWPQDARWNCAPSASWTPPCGRAADEM